MTQKSTAPIILSLKKKMQQDMPPMPSDGYAAELVQRLRKEGGGVLPNGCNIQRLLREVMLAYMAGREDATAGKE